MPQFIVDDDVALLVERLAKPKPFENLSFNDALRRILQGQIAAPANEKKDADLEKLLAEALANVPKKASSPDPLEWVALVPELKGKRDLNSWKAICAALKIETAGDSARRKLKNWVRANRPMWPSVPEV